MITRLEALNFRCFRYLSLPLGRFQLLSGPTGSGKSACLDAIRFIHDLIAEDLEAAILRRAGDLGDLVHDRQASRFELAVEAEIPPELRQQTSFPDYPVVRYEVAIGVDEAGRGPAIVEEKVLLEAAEPDTGQRDLFPVPVTEPETILRSSRLRSNRTVMAKVLHGNDNFYAEVDRPEGKFWTPSFKLGPRSICREERPATIPSFRHQVGPPAMRRPKAPGCHSYGPLGRSVALSSSPKGRRAWS